MTGQEKRTLIAQAAKLTTLGYKMDAAREKLRRLVEKQVPFNSDKMKKALMEFERLDSQWKQLEQEHLTLRNAEKIEFM